MQALNGDLLIGAIDEASPADLFRGWIDEIRFYDEGEKTADFIVRSTEYGNQI